MERSWTRLRTTHITKTANDRLQIFALGPNGIVMWKRWDSNRWLNNNRWDYIKDKTGKYPRMRKNDESPALTGQFAAAKILSTIFERVDLMARTTDGRVMHTFWNGSH